MLLFALMSSKLKISILGYGAFGQLMAQVLSDYFEIYAYSRSLEPGKKDKFARFVSLEDLKESDVIILSVPVQFLEELLAKLKEEAKIKESAVLVDVSSVKLYPMELMKKYFPNNPRLGTHPIFGPQSVKKYGLKSSKIVLCNDNLSLKNYKKIKDFLAGDLKLDILEKTAEKHDKEMALVQGITHFIGRALAVMDIKDLDSGTFSYRHLLELKELLKDDSWELFETIQNFNKYTVKERKKLIKILEKLNEDLQK